MKIAVTATDTTLESPVDPRFGRCPYFLIIETDDLSFEAVANPNVSRANGAGIQAAQLVVDKGVRFVVTGNCGPNAFNTLAAAGIDVIVGGSGTVRDAVENFRAGRHAAAEEPNVSSHFGSGQNLDQTSSPSVSPQMTSDFAGGSGMGRGRGGGMGMGMGMGMGRGMGRGGGAGVGMGRGMGRGGSGGMGMGRGMGRSGGAANPPSGPQLQPVPQPRADAGQDLDALRTQAQVLEEQLAALNQRMGQIQQTATARRLTAVVDDGMCTGCGICAQVCPVGAVTVNTVAMIDAGICTACGECVAECPQGAITLRKVR